MRSMTFKQLFSMVRRCNVINDTHCNSTSYRPNPPYPLIWVLLTNLRWKLKRKSYVETPLLRQRRQNIYQDLSAHQDIQLQGRLLQKWLIQESMTQGRGPVLVQTPELVLGRDLRQKTEICEILDAVFLMPSVSYSRMKAQIDSIRNDCPSDIKVVWR